MPLDATPPVAIRLVKVKKHFKDRDVEALAEIDLEVARSEFIALIGPSGSGKSTLLELLGDIGDEGGPSGGDILIEGKTPQELRQARGYGLVFQDSILFPWYRVFENCLLPFRIAKSGVPEEEQTRRVELLLKMVGLDRKFWSYYPKELSGGMQQRVAIVRALALDPPLLLMDEPFGALDDLTRKSMQMLLLDIWAKTRKTILMVTHSISEACFMSDRVVILSHRPGRIVRIVSIPLDRPRERSMTETKAFARICAMVRDALGSGEREEDRPVKD
ncbi:MAG TPA: ABC transporter ATP-binding protein [Thermodesulfobacteriota bacterium]|nr:ABC transporter ATP-binding protein [Thermodesulfobacteriota bacterium]